VGSGNHGVKEVTASERLIDHTLTFDLDAFLQRDRTDLESKCLAHVFM